MRSRTYILKKSMQVPFFTAFMSNGSSNFQAMIFIRVEQVISPIRGGFITVSTYLASIRFRAGEHRSRTIEVDVMQSP